MYGIGTSNTTQNILFQDMNVHGVTLSGFYGAIGGAITMTRVRSAFNGFAGWNFDDGTPDNPAASINASYVTMEWNGCNEEYPIVDPVPAISCYSITNHGFGDAWSGQDSLLSSFTCNYCIMRYNVKDAFTGPHTSIGALTITNSMAATFAGPMELWWQL
jgi:hypothetical protein